MQYQGGSTAVLLWGFVYVESITWTIEATLKGYLIGHLICYLCTIYSYMPIFAKVWSLILYCQGWVQTENSYHTHIVKDLAWVHKTSASCSMPNLQSRNWLLWSTWKFWTNPTMSLHSQVCRFTSYSTDFGLFTTAIDFSSFWTVWAWGLESADHLILASSIDLRKIQTPQVYSGILEQIKPF